VADQASGIDLMRRRIERASRQPPPAPRTRPPAGADTAAPVVPTAEAPTAEAPTVDTAPAVVDTAPVGEGGGATRPPPARRRATAAPARRPRLAPDLPPVNLAIRVRKPLDDHLADVIHDLRRAGVRTSKVEIIEMLLWEQTSEDAAAVRERLGAFRAAAPRGAGASI
jgi:hypothetical protein